MERKRILKRLYGEPPKFDPNMVEALLRDVETFEEMKSLPDFELAYEFPSGFMRAWTTATQDGVYRFFDTIEGTIMLGPDGKQIGEGLGTALYAWDEGGLRAVIETKDRKKQLLINKEGEILAEAKYFEKFDMPTCALLSANYPDRESAPYDLFDAEGTLILKEFDYISTRNVGDDMCYFFAGKDGKTSVVDEHKHVLFADVNVESEMKNGEYFFLVSEKNGKKALYDNQGNLITDDLDKLYAVRKMQGKKYFTVNEASSGRLKIIGPDNWASSDKYEISYSLAEAHGKAYYAGRRDAGAFIVEAETGEEVAGPYDQIPDLKVIGGEIYYLARPPKEENPKHQFFLFDSNHQKIGNGYDLASSLFDIDGQVFFNAILLTGRDAIEHIVGPDGELFRPDERMQIKEKITVGNKTSMIVEQQGHPPTYSLFFPDGTQFQRWLHKIFGVYESNGKIYVYGEQGGQQGVFGMDGIPLVRMYDTIKHLKIDQNDIRFFHHDRILNKLQYYANGQLYDLSPGDVSDSYFHDHGKRVYWIEKENGLLMDETADFREEDVDDQTFIEVGPNFFYGVTKTDQGKKQMYLKSYSGEYGPFGPYDHLYHVGKIGEHTLVVLAGRDGKLIEQHYDVEE